MADKKIEKNDKAAVDQPEANLEGTEAKSGQVEIRRDEHGNVSIHNPESDKADNEYQGVQR